MTDIRKLCERVLEILWPHKQYWHSFIQYPEANELIAAAPILAREVQKQRETIEKLREALSFYADEKSWLVPTDENGVLTRGYSDTDIEGGDKARRVIEETK